MADAGDVLGALLDQPFVGLLLIQDDLVKYANKAAARINEYSIEEMLKWQPMQYMDTIHLDDRVAASALMKWKKNGNGSNPPCGTHRVICKHNRIKWVEQCCRPVVHEGRPAYLVMMTEITEREEAAIALEISHEELERLAEAVEEAAEAIVITDTNGTIRYVNPWFEQVTGYSRDEALGKNPAITGSGMHGEAFYKDMWSTINSGKTWRGHFVNRKKDGTIYEEDAVISPVKNNEGEITSFVAVKRDVTQEKLLQDEVRESQKMAAIGQLANRVAHDFTNVLVMILGNAHLAQSKTQSMPDVSSYLSEIIKAANRVSTLTAELLAFAHPAPLRLETMKLDNALRGAEEILKRTIGNELTLTIKCDSGIGKVTIDPMQIEQMLVHLAINTVEAMPRGGTLTIKAARAKLSAAELVHLRSDHPLDSRRNDGFVVISVSDNGPGMTKEQKLRCFEPFFSTRKKDKSAGLGLSTVYRIVDQHNGSISVQSTVGKGTTFRILLPLATKKT